ncbi:hypothetical protein X947_5684 [Burkholderia pseudomallei MSHR7334]|nr:hypothetical protein X947_5684 [Burkholderia pseudomallei MSHR7334]
MDREGCFCLFCPVGDGHSFFREANSHSDHRRLAIEPRQSRAIFNGVLDECETLRIWAARRL